MKDAVQADIDLLQAELDMEMDTSTSGALFTATSTSGSAAKKLKKKPKPPPAVPLSPETLPPTSTCDADTAPDADLTRLLSMHLDEDRQSLAAERGGGMGRAAELGRGRDGRGGNPGEGKKKKKTAQVRTSTKSKSTAKAAKISLKPKPLTAKQQEKQREKERKLRDREEKQEEKKRAAAQAVRRPRGRPRRDPVPVSVSAAARVSTASDWRTGEEEKEEEEEEDMEGEEEEEADDEVNSATMTPKQLRQHALHRSQQLRADSTGPTVSSAATSTNAGVYRQTPIGMALLAALTDLTRSGVLGPAVAAKKARQAILSLFDQHMEMQMEQASKALVQALGMQLREAGVGLRVKKEGRSGGSDVKHTSGNSLPGPGPDNSFSSSSSSAATPASAAPISASMKKLLKPPVLQGTLSCYQCHSGMWNLQCEDVTLFTGHRTLHLPMAKIVMYAEETDVRGERKGRKKMGTIAAAKADQALKEAIG